MFFIHSSETLEIRRYKCQSIEHIAASRMYVWIELLCFLLLFLPLC
jgi:hypothetical protein